MNGAVVVAKAPVAGQAKTRLAERVGDEAAAHLAAAALLDTLDAVEQWTPAPYRLIALTGDLALAARGTEIESRLASWMVVAQRGTTFAARLVAAHQDAARLWGGRTPLVQIGMDTPSLVAGDLQALVAALDPDVGPAADAVLGPAVDGGWWALATRRSGLVDGLVDVAMSRPDTCRQTRAALEIDGAHVREVHRLRDVDTFEDAAAVAAADPHTRFALALAGHQQEVRR